jgi:hypothetical protein
MSPAFFTNLLSTLWTFLRSPDAPLGRDGQLVSFLQSGMQLVKQLMVFIYKLILALLAILMVAATFAMAVFAFLAYLLTSAIVGANRATTAVREGRALRSTLKAHKNHILGLTGSERVTALTTWKRELDSAVQGRIQAHVDRQRTRRLGIHARALLSILMLALSIYLLAATPMLPFPGWGTLSSLPFGVLFYVGLAFGITSLTLARPIIAILSPDRKTRYHKEMLRQETAGRRGAYALKWVWEIWLGGTPWLPIVATAIDLALGYVIAEKSVELFYHPAGDVDVLITSAMIAITQMIFGGCAWYIRFLGQYGLGSPREKALGWVEGHLELAKQPKEESRRQVVLYWIVRTVWTLMLLTALGVYLWILGRFYTGFLAKPHLTDGEANLVKLYLTASGLAAGIFFAGLASMSTQSGVSKGQKTANMLQDMGNMVLSLPGNAAPAAGSWALQTWGRTYSPAWGAALQGVYQQASGITLGLLTNLFHSGLKWKRGKRAAS